MIFNRNFSFLTGYVLLVLLVILYRKELTKLIQIIWVMQVLTVILSPFLLKKHQIVNSTCPSDVIHKYIFCGELNRNLFQNCSEFGLKMLTSLTDSGFTITCDRYHIFLASVTVTIFSSSVTANIVNILENSELWKKSLLERQ